MMSNLVYQWNSVLEVARKEGMPEGKKRGILREYIQALFLQALYSHKESKNLHFIGGTSLRILRGIDRFSEDLDFDSLGLFASQIKKLFFGSIALIERYGISVEGSFKGGAAAGRGSMKFPGLLRELDLSHNPYEKLNIQFDYTKPSWEMDREVVFMSHLGVSGYVVTNTLDTLLAEKIAAFLWRPYPRARDMYDIFWLLGNGASLKIETLRSRKISTQEECREQILKRFEELKPELNKLKKQLAPFLFNEENICYIDMFPDLVKKKL